MKTACLLVVIIGLFTAGQAELDTDALVEVGKTVVNGLVEKGKELLASAASDFLSKLLSSSSLTDLIGKRDLSLLGDLASNVLDKLKGLADKGKQLATTVFSDTINKLKALAKTFHSAIGSLEDASQVVSTIDAVVADHHDRQKRVLGTLLEKAKELLAGAVEKAKGLASKVKEHASDFVSSALQTGVDIFGKRQLSDHLQAIGNAISSAVSPFKDVVSGLGETLKGHFSNLIDTVKGHASQLQTKLQPHIDDLKGHGQKLLDHGKNALGALSEVLGDILNQTVENASGSLSGIAGTVQDAGKTVVDHFAGSSN